MKSEYKSLLTLFLGVAITLWPALYNQYVLVFTDSELYIKCGNELSFTEDRSFVYGWFVGITSFHHSLWYTIVSQSVIFNLTCYTFVRQITKEYINIVYASVITFLCLFTSLAWDVCYIMPDIFSIISILLLIILLQHKQKLSLPWIGIFVSYLLCLQMHFSFMLYHVVAMFLILVTNICYRNLFYPSSLKNNALILLGVVVNLALFIGEKKALGSEGFSKVSHIYLMGKLVENGLLKAYLDNECENNKYEICKYKDSLAQNNYSGNFLFHPSSAFQKTGAWANPHEEYKIIIKDILFSRKYAWLYAKSIGIETIKTFDRNAIGSSIYSYPKGGWGPYPAIEKYYNQEKTAYSQSLQNQNKLNFPFEFISKVYLFLLIISAIGMLYFFRYNAMLILITIITLLSNAMITGGLVGIEDRYATRQNYLVIIVFSLLLSSSVLRYLKKGKNYIIF